MTTPDNIQHLASLHRRAFLRGGMSGLGMAALAALLQQDGLLANDNVARPLGGLAGLPHFAPWAKRVIFLCMSGAPSQIDLFDYKPELERLQGEEIPDSVRMGQRLTTMTVDQSSRPLTPSLFAFEQHGQCGAWVSELLPHTASVADDLCFIRSMHTEAINHDPAITFLQTGSEHPGRPSLGAWLSYGLGSLNQELPAFVVMISGGGLSGDQPLYGRLWGSGFLPSNHQAVQLLSQGDPVLYLSNPPGIDRASRRRMLDAIADLNREQHAVVGDDDTLARIKQYEMAFHMQASVPKLVDLADEPDSTFALYGDDARKRGTFAANCLQARRLVESGVRFVQLYHRDWDHHGNLPRQIRTRCSEIDQASAALVTDLKQRGLLDDTLIIWGGEFGRTSFSQGVPTVDNYGRDHHPRCYTMWLTGGGVKRGLSYGQTDEFSYNVIENGVHVHDLHATMLHLLGIDHERLTYRFQGRDYRLTDVAGRVVKDIIA
jgi:uncharacterized protein (DUF1501 family)